MVELTKVLGDYPVLGVTRLLIWPGWDTNTNFTYRTFVELRLFLSDRETITYPYERESDFEDADEPKSVETLDYFNTGLLISLVRNASYYSYFPDPFSVSCPSTYE